MTDRSFWRAFWCCSLAAALISCGKEARQDGVALEGAVVGRWTMDVDAAKALAAERELPLLFSFTGSDWCQYCQLMQREVFAQQDWQSYADERIVLVTIDRPEDVSLVPKKYRKRNAQLHETLNIQAVPAYVLFDSDGQTILSRFGIPPQGVSASAFLAQVSAALRHRPAQIDTFVQGMTEQEARTYRDLLAQQRETRDQFEKWLKTNPPRNDANTAIFSDYQAKAADVEQRIVDTEMRKTFSVLSADDIEANHDTLRTVGEYAQLLGELMSVRNEMDDWLLLRPEENDGSKAKLRAFTSRIQTLLGKIRDVTKQGASKPEGDTAPVRQTPTPR